MVCYRFDELPLPASKAISQHLVACESCRMEFERLGAAEDPAAPSIADKLDSLLVRLRGWQSAESRLESSGEALRQRVAGALEPYLGKGAMHTLLAPVRDDGRDLFADVAPLLTMFLGRRAAGPLVTYVVENTIVRL